jgi:hypothetical protein
MEDILMSFIRNANPDATNSELDAKQVIFNDYKFADEIVDPLENIQDKKEEIIEQWVELVVDGMDMKTLVNIVADNMTSYYHEGSLEELKDEIDNYDEELWDELVDNCGGES